MRSCWNSRLGWSRGVGMSSFLLQLAQRSQFDAFWVPVLENQPTAPALRHLKEHQLEEQATSTFLNT